MRWVMIPLLGLNIIVARCFGRLMTDLPMHMLPADGHRLFESRRNLLCSRRQRWKCLEGLVLSAS